MNATDNAGNRNSGLVQRLQAIVDRTPAEGITIGQLRNELADSAFGGLLAILALPCCVPFVYVLPQIVAVPMAVIAFQMALGRPAPWLPDALASRVLAQQDLERLVHRTGPMLSALQMVARERLRPLTTSALRPGIGILLAVFSLCILMPVPGTNTVPGIAVLIVALGLLERDGVLIVAGVMLGTVWIAILIAGVAFGGLWITRMVFG